MAIELVRRPERSRVLSLTSPLIALGLAIIFGGIIFALIGLTTRSMRSTPTSSSR